MERERRKLEFDFSERLARVEERVLSNERSVTSALFASDKAIAKAEAASEKRLDSVNEFREQLKDQQGTFLTRNEYVIAHDSLIEKTASLSSRLDKLEGTGKGLGMGWVFLLGFISVISALFSISSQFWKH